MNKETFKACICSAAHGNIELEGTKEQLNAFNAAKEAIEEALFPRILSYEKFIKLALDCGLSVKKREQQ